VTMEGRLEGRRDSRRVSERDCRGSRTHDPKADEEIGCTGRHAVSEKRNQRSEKEGVVEGGGAVISCKERKVKRWSAHPSMHVGHGRASACDGGRAPATGRRPLTLLFCEHGPCLGTPGEIWTSHHSILFQHPTPRSSSSPSTHPTLRARTQMALEAGGSASGLR
jgi:hypothetical protein